MFTLVRRFLVRDGVTLPARRIDPLSRDIAERCAAEICGRLSDSALRMSTAELRGYVRARAALPVRRLAERLCAERGLPTSAARLLANRALERVTQQMVREILARPIALVPSAAPLRAAA